jgi:RNA polymerase sigma-70 factor (ECF subfamily)
LVEKTEIYGVADHLFRHECGKLVSILTRTFGSENLELAEDVVQDSLVEAIGNWSYQGVPGNPAAWIFQVAKNKALNILNREKYKKQYAANTMPLLESEQATQYLSLPFSEYEILDDQLRMIFACCHPSISADSQIALALKTLCGFSIEEIARAYLTTEENIKKRLVRARQAIRENKIPFEVPTGKELENRLRTVLETIYLLFNEGYSASTGVDLIRYDLCEEAIRLAEMIAQHPAIREKPDVYALLALMQLNSSRFKSRQDDQGNLLTLEEQDRSLWNRELITQGILNLQRSLDGKHTSVYQVLAAISANHCSAPKFELTDWKAILSLYNKLVEMDSSPIVLLNRTVAISRVDGPEAALQHLDGIKENVLLENYPLFYSTGAEFHIQLNQFSSAINCLERAVELTRVEAERRLLQKKIDLCRKRIN